jgi:D-alanyl-D-alanine carboxypeptidase
MAGLPGPQARGTSVTRRQDGRVEEIGAHARHPPGKEEIMISRLSSRALRRLSAATALAVLGACAEEPSQESRALSTRLEQALDAALASGEVHSATVRVVSPRDDVNVAAARGEADPERHIAMTPETRFKIASVTKPMTAAVVLRLWELGRLDLDAPVSRYLDGRDVDFDRLHVLNGRSSGRQITVRQLLQHTSGLPDWWEDGPRDENGLTEFMQMALTMGLDLWDPRGTVRFASERLSPPFPPGAGFHYSDTNYSLLGLLVERVTGGTLAAAYREHVFGPLHMRDSYLEFFEPSPSGAPVSHAFLGAIDAATLNTSWDWGGGGVVSTTADLDDFARGLFESDLFRRSTTLDEMLRFRDVPSDFRSDGYGLGTEVVKTERADYVGHYGSIGVLMLYDRERHISVTGTINQATPEFGTFVAGVLTAVDETLPR